MPTLPIEITEARADLVKWAVSLSGGQVKTAEILCVTPATVGRWTRQLGPIPQAVIFWAKAVIEEKKNQADDV